MLIELKQNAHLTDYQQHVKEVCKAYGWDHVNDTELFMLFMEEVGELAKAMRNHKKLFQEEERAHKKFELEEEFADVFGYLLDLANHFNINLDTAYRKKNRINAKRNWD